MASALGVGPAHSFMVGWVAVKLTYAVNVIGEYYL